MNCTWRIAYIYPYDTLIKMVENISIFSDTMLHDNLVTGIATTVAMSEVLYYGEELDHSLINQNQVRNDGI